MEENKVWKAALYVRLSKEDGDKEESDSITNQKELIREYLKSIPNIEIVSEMVDDGFSGVDFGRPSFMRMMEDIKAGRVDCVVVKDLSRFGRNFTETGKYIENVFPFLGVRFISINDNIDSVNKKSPSDSILIPFKNLVNDAYCRDISVKIRSQLEIKRKKGDFIGAFAVYGYLKDTNSRNKLVVDEYAAAVVRDIFKWKLDGMSQQGIANKLNSLGVLSPMEYKKSLGLRFSSSFKLSAQAKWSSVAVGRIIRDEIYIGVMAQGKTGTPNHKVKKNFHKAKEDWIRVFDTHEPIINREDFQLANRLLENDTRVAPGEEAVYLFSGLARCSRCGENMIRKTVPAGDKKYVYYVCCKGCAGQRIAESLFAESVDMALQSHISNILNLERILLFIDKLPLKQEEVQKIDRQLAKKREEIDRYRKLKVSLYESLMGGLIDETEYLEMKDEYSARCEEAEQAALLLNGEIEKILNNKGEKNAWIEHFKQFNNYETLTRKIAVSLIDGITVYEKNRIEIRYMYQYNYNATISFTQTVNDMQPLQGLKNLLGEAI